MDLHHLVLATLVVAAALFGLVLSDESWCKQENIRFLAGVNRTNRDNDNPTVGCEQKCYGALCRSGKNMFLQWDCTQGFNNAEGLATAMENSAYGDKELGAYKPWKCVAELGALGTEISLAAHGYPSAEYPLFDPPKSTKAPRPTKPRRRKTPTPLQQKFSTTNSARDSTKNASADNGHIFFEFGAPNIVDDSSTRHNAGAVQICVTVAAILFGGFALLNAAIIAV